MCSFREDILSDHICFRRILRLVVLVARSSIVPVLVPSSAVQLQGQCRSSVATLAAASSSLAVARPQACTSVAPVASSWPAELEEPSWLAVPVAWPWQAAIEAGTPEG